MIEVGESSRVGGEEPRDIPLDVVTAGVPVLPDEEIPLGDRDGTPDAEDGESRDIPVDTERQVVMAPAESEPEEDSEDFSLPAASPVRGGVMRLGEGSDGSEGEDEAEQMSESDPEEAEPEEYADDMGTTADDIIEALTTANEELEDRVGHLEEQNQVHQYMEDQYRDVAHQRQAEAVELRQANADLIRQLEQEVTRADRFRVERDATRTELQAVRGELAVEAQTRDFIQGAWVNATARTDDLERQVRRNAARIDATTFAFETAMGRLRSRIQRFPREEGRTRRVISRRVVDRMIRQEFQDAVRRTDQ